jgi:adenine-specific DNA-methyltransferase
MSTENKNLANQENPLIKVQTKDWNKERLEQLKQLMPDLFTNDGKLNIYELKKVIDPKSVNETERYEFRWFGKSNAKREAFTPTDATLVYDEKRSVNPTESDNLIIEGENLAVLKLLSNSYREQVKCIYIDPPYNTGKDFVYSDKFNQDKKDYWEDAEITENGFKIDTNAETDGRFHSNWLNMMYSRLLIARQLLKEDGVIFISIDDNEVHHLRKLCDEVFGEECFVEQFSWVKTSTPPGLSTKSRKTTEYVLCYEKNSTNNKFRGELLDGGDQPLLNSGNKNRDLKFPKEKVKFNLSDGKYLTGTYDRVFLKEDIEVINNFSTTDLILNGEFKWIQKKLDDEIKNDTTFIIKSEKFAIRFLRNDEGGYKAPTNLIKEKYISPIINKKDNKVDTNETSSKKLETLLGGRYFDFPKPSSLIAHLVNFCTSDNDIILDFFAGSGTTGQAITELNQEDASTGSAQVGNRKYILVQLPEQTDEKSEAYKAGYKKISDITIERNKRVVEKIIKEKKETTPDLFNNTSTGSAQEKESEQEQLKGLGFKVFKLQKSNFPRVEFAPDPELSDEENIELLKKYIKDKEAQLVNAFNRDELITEILIKNGFKLNYRLTKQEEFKKNEILFATDGDKETLICLDVIIANETVEHFKVNIDQKLIVLERALDTTKKWNLKHAMGDKFNAF